MELDRKEFHFDLDIKLLKDVYPSKHENAWKMVLTTSSIPVMSR